VPLRLDVVQSRASRAARGWVTGALATVAAAVSHGVADGGAPSALAFGSALVFAGVLGTFLIGRRASLPRLVGIVAGSQLAFHFVFSYLTPGTATGGSHHGPAVLEPAVAHHGTDPGMWAAHAIAMLVTLVFLRRAELALWSLLRDALAVSVDRMPAIQTQPSVPRVALSAAPRHPVSFVVLSALRDRGPPVLAGV
jgi:hypothetical protein